jgi:hypothetical protein
MRPIWGRLDDVAGQDGTHLELAEQCAAFPEVRRPCVECAQQFAVEGAQLSRAHGGERRVSHPRLHGPHPPPQIRRAQPRGAYPPPPRRCLSTPTQTSIMAVQFDRGVVVGADSRTTSGSYIVRRSSLALFSPDSPPGQSCHRQAHPHPRSPVLLSIGVRSRHPGHRRHRPLELPAHNVRRTRAILGFSPFHRQMRGVPPSVATAAATFEKLCYENKDRLSAGIIVAGWDNEVGPSVYNIPLGGGLFRQPWAIGGASPIQRMRSLTKAC